MSCDIVASWRERWWPALLAGGAALLLPWWWLGGVLAGLIATWLVVAMPVALPAALVASVPLQELLQLPGGVSATQACAIAGALGWMVLRSAGAPGGGWPPAAVLAWAGWIGALALSAVVAPLDHRAALREVARWCVALLAWALCVDLVTRRRDAVLLLAALLLSATAAAAYGVWQFAVGAGPPTFRIAADLPFVRAAGTMGQPNSFAVSLNQVWPVAAGLGIAALGITRRDARWRWPVVLGAAAIWAACGVLLAALGASFSRGGWLGALAGAATLALASGPRGRRLVIAGAVIIAALVALAALGALPTALATRILSIGALLQPPDPASVAITAENFAILERLAQLRAGTGMAIAHPWLGVGPGNFSAAYPHHAVAPWLISRGHAHNAYITIAAEVGLIGLIAYLGLIGTTLWRLMRALTHIRGTLARGIILGCCGMIASVAVHQLFEHAHVLNLTVVYAAVLGLAEAALRHDRGANGDEERQSCGFW